MTIVPQGLCLNIPRTLTSQGLGKIRQATFLPQPCSRVLICHILKTVSKNGPITLYRNASLPDDSSALLPWFMAPNPGPGADSKQGETGGKWVAQVRISYEDGRCHLNSCGSIHI